MQIRYATQSDLPWISRHDPHISPEELAESIRRGRVLLGFEEGDPIGWLRWNLFWDNTPFLNMLFFLPGFRRRGFGRELVSAWESSMWRHGFSAVMTSTLSNESAQHFYRAMGYRDVGGLLLPGEATEILFRKECNNDGSV